MAYEDLSTGLRSKAALNRVFRHLDAEVISHLELCRFDMLRDPDLHDWAAREARRCHMVVISAHGRGELPNEVVDWIHSWADHRRPQGGALVASFDDKVRQEADSNGTLACLRKVAAETGLLLLCHFGSTPRRTWELIVQCIRKRTHPASPTEEDALGPLSPGPRWGINE